MAEQLEKDDNCIELSKKLKKLDKSLKAKKHTIKLLDGEIKTFRLEASDSGSTKKN